MRLLLLIFFGVALVSGTAEAAEYVIDKAASSISFSGTHAGNEFKGAFGDWDAKITFDPDNLESSRISAIFNPASAKTGNKMYDGTLPQADWFDVKNHPAAFFESTAITANSDSTYMAEGVLTIRSVEQPISFIFSLSDLGNAPVHVQSNFKIDRLAYGMGKKSDPEAKWVSRDISLELDLKAQK